jgi:hypothetical protein
MDHQGVGGAKGANKPLQIQALLDSGSLAGDFISQELVNKLQANHLLHTVQTTICSGFDNNCNDSFKGILVNLSYINEISFKTINLILKPLVLPKSPIDLIIGRASLKEHKFSFSTPSHFASDKPILNDMILDASANTDTIEDGFEVQPLTDASPSEVALHLAIVNSTCKSDLDQDESRWEDSVSPSSEKGLDVVCQNTGNSRCSCCAISQGYHAVVGTNLPEPVLALPTREKEGTSVKPTVTVQDQPRGRRHKTNWVLL